MTNDRSLPGRPLRVAIWVAVPVVLAIAVHFGHDVPAAAGRDDRLHDRARDAVLGFAATAMGFAEAALESPLPEAVAGIPESLRVRLQGIAIRQDGVDRWLDWTGTPADTPTSLLDRDTPGWTILRDGASFRLIAVAGPDPVGRRAAATFLIHAPHEQDRDASALLGRTGPPLELELRTDRPGSHDQGWVEVVSPGGPRVWARARPLPQRPLALSAGAVAAIGLLWVLFPWGAWIRTARGTLAAVFAIVAARAVLAWTGLPSPPLPAEIADAAWYGTSALGGLLSSPLDLALTALAALALSRTVTRGFLGILGVRPDRPRAAANVVLAATATTLLVLVATSLAVDGRVHPLAIGKSLGHPAGLAVVLAVGVLLLAAAEPWGALRPSLARKPDGTPRMAATAIAAIPLAAIAGLAWQSGYDRLALDRLETDYAPQVLEQRARRGLALDATVGWAASEASSRFAEASAGGRRALDNLVYDLWASSPLYHAGYRSSLTLHLPDGETLAHFGFDIPPLDEIAGERAPIREEEFELLTTVRERLLHHEADVVVDGETVAVVVGHVLDEPDNLGFLPVPRAYLACLGHRDAPWSAAGDSPFAAPEYVGYSPLGVARFHTLDQPPGWTYAFDRAAVEGRPVRVIAGDVPYFALPIVEPSRLHLLLTPAPTWLDRLGTFARLAMLALVLLVALDGLPRLVRPGGPREAILGLQRSYLRKLVAALLVASVVPWVGLSFALRANLEQRGDAAREASATQLAVVAQRVIEDYVASLPEDEAPELPDDALLYWLRRLVGQDIHLYERGELVASSKRELFSAGLAVPHLPADVNFQINQSNRPVLVRPESLGPVSIPVAYAPVRAGRPAGEVVVAVPLVLHQPEIARAVARNIELMLLSTLLVAAVLAATAVPLARAVARPVRDLVRAAGSVAAGDYGARLTVRGDDEVAELTRGFNTMVAALARQRADLVRRRDYMEALLQNATTGVVSTDDHGRIVTLNPAAAALLSREGAEPRLDEDLAAAVDRSPALAPLAERLRSPVESPDPDEINLTRPDGSARRLRLVRVELPDPEGGPAGRLVLFEDVTDLMRRNQLEAWAEMARAIAHEIKNPLTPIQLSAEHLERILADRGVLPSQEIEACLETVRKQVRSLREIASEFSAYAKVPALSPEAIDPVAFVDEVVAPYRAAPPEQVEVILRNRPCPATLIDQRVLGRAIVNLIENGLHAMPDGGRLTVACEPGPDGETRIEVSDTGHGLSEEARARLFEPYFSTKSSGTGLGLAIVRRAVDGHGGTIEVDGADGDGTTFRIRLPAAGRTDDA